MARRKADERIELRPWMGTPRPLPMKYHEKALLPSQLMRGDEGAWEYLSADGIRMRAEVRGAYDNTAGWCADRLEELSQELYGMPFASIEAAWARRIGRLDGWWQIVRLERLDATESE